jgi:hypothetical protein
VIFIFYNELIKGGTNMTYKIVKDVQVDCGDHGFTWQETLKEGFKTIRGAEFCLTRKFNSRKYKDKLWKLFNERHANKIDETYVILNENGDRVNDAYWTRTIRKDKEV